MTVECGKVIDMSLFHTGTGKPLKIEEYDQAQAQATMHVSTICICICVSNYTVGSNLLERNLGHFIA